MKQRILGVVFAGCAAVLGQAAVAADFPSKSINFVVPYSPGGGTDIASRLITEKISREKGWSFIVDNRPGASGSVALAYLTRQKPDGHMLAMGQTSNLSINPFLNKDIAYDTQKDFTPIAVVNSQPMVVVVAAKSKYQNFEELVADAKAGKRLTMGTPGIGTVSHMSMEYFGQQADVAFRHIPYPGATQAITEVMGGQLAFAATSLPSALSHIRAGSVRALAVTSKERNASVPDVPSIAELGYDDFDVGDWKAVVAPAGVSDDVAKQLNAAVNDALKDKDVIVAFEREGSEIVGGSADDFKALLDKEQARWEQVIAAAKIDKK